VAATFVVSIAIAVYVIAGQKPPVVKGQVLAVWDHPQHTTSSGFDASGAPMAQETVDQMFVFAKVSLRNQTDHPVFVTDILANVTLADGIHSSYAANKTDYDRLFVAYPNLTVTHGPALSPLDTEIGPGQTVEGEFVAAFRGLSKQQWDARKKLDFTFNFRYQPSLVLAPQLPVIDQ
jgi:hypothetical protein